LGKGVNFGKNKVIEKEKNRKGGTMLINVGNSKSNRKTAKPLFVYLLTFGVSITSTQGIFKISTFSHLKSFFDVLLKFISYIKRR